MSPALDEYSLNTGTKVSTRDIPAISAQLHRKKHSVAIRKNIGPGITDFAGSQVWSRDVFYLAATCRDDLQASGSGRLAEDDGTIAPPAGAARTAGGGKNGYCGTTLNRDFFQARCEKSNPLTVR